jgi:hypothetical protein
MTSGREAYPAYFEKHDEQMDRYNKFRGWQEDLLFVDLHNFMEEPVDRLRMVLERRDTDDVISDERFEAMRKLHQSIMGPSSRNKKDAKAKGLKKGKGEKSTTVKVPKASDGGCQARIAVPGSGGSSSMRCQGKDGHVSPHSVRLEW